ncbi:MAG: AcrVA2 family anti-CRISPR protein [Ruminiclostridium sp.]
MKRKQKLPLPLQCVKDFEQKHPRCWEYIEDFRKKRGKEVPCWNDLVYIPLIDANSIFKAKYNNGKNDINQASIYAAYAAWRQYKEIYSFSPELTEVLFAQADEDIVIPTDVLYQIPYNSIYISISETEGFFVFFEWNIITNQMELRFCCIEDDNGNSSITNVWVNLDSGNTISEGIRKGLNCFRTCMGGIATYKLLIDGEYVVQTEQQMIDEMYRIASKYIQLVLYICSENAEIEENPVQKQITRRPADNRPKDVFREIRSWDVGVKFAKNIKKSRQQSAESETERHSSSPGAPKRPHTRRGHWHHYWVGSDKDNSRKLILKWTAPMFIGGGSNDTIATVNEIE